VHRRGPVRRAPGDVSDWRIAADELVAYVRATYAPIGIVIAGSLVRGEGGPTSDLDVFVVHAEPWRLRDQRVFAGVPAELFVNPAAQVRRYFASEHERARPCTAHMFATGEQYAARPQDAGILTDHLRQVRGMVKPLTNIDDIKTAAGEGQVLAKGIDDIGIEAARRQGCRDGAAPHTWRGIRLDGRDLKSRFCESIGGNAVPAWNIQDGSGAGGFHREQSQGFGELRAGGKAPGIVGEIGRKIGVKNKILMRRIGPQNRNSLLPAIFERTAVLTAHQCFSRRLTVRAGFPATTV